MKKLLVGFVALGFAASFIALLSVRSRTRNPSQAEDFAHLQHRDVPAALWASPEFSFKANTGEVVSKQSLTGRPYIANFIFTTCRTVCPLMTAKMVRVQRELKDAPMRFVSFSVDPATDTAEVLAKYAEQWNPGEKRWVLLETTPPGLAAVVSGFHVTVQKTDAGVDPIMHSSVMLLVDERGVVRGIYDSEDPADFRALIAASRVLLGSTAPSPAKEARSGEVLFHEFSCSNCHAHPELAPPLGGLVGRKRTLENGLVATADLTYIKESLVAPDAKRVQGYPLRMPTYYELATPAELDALAAYVAALPEEAPEADAVVAVDPVCHMKVRVSDTALHLSADGGTTYFCSAWCKQRFAENPDAYRK